MGPKPLKMQCLLNDLLDLGEDVVDGADSLDGHEGSLAAVTVLVGNDRV